MHQDPRSLEAECAWSTVLQLERAFRRSPLTRWEVTKCYSARCNDNPEKNGLLLAYRNNRHGARLPRAAPQISEQSLPCVGVHYIEPITPSRDGQIPAANGALAGPAHSAKAGRFDLVRYLLRCRYDDTSSLLIARLSDRGYKDAEGTVWTGEDLRPVMDAWGRPLNHM
ncbi:hypothetical protein DNTS_035394 [Danionella cerebrum]|uniref:Uncharacterized protein n=1 Tax=Danionella cerebrum TaxID=2873325 RepID=A0A553NWB3_9TELE|nr:hypothetical protein DNTS_035394 [Danionella translucida]